MSRLDAILAMPAERRRKVDLRRKRGKYKRHPRRRHSREELIQFLRQNDIRSVRKLSGSRTDSDPNAYDYQKEFGSWAAAKLAAFGPPPPRIGKFDAAYLAKAVIEFDLWTRDKYQRARMADPEAFPSLHFIYREWGTFRKLKEYAQQVSMKKMLESYLSLWRRLGRKPTLKECDEEGINLERPLKYFGSKREMDRVLSGLEI
jgi:hypothetical protein